MRYRIYWWVRGTPEDRLGGPWWYKDFDSQLAQFAAVQFLRRFCEKVYMLSGTDMPKHKMLSIRPPQEARYVP